MKHKPDTFYLNKEQKEFNKELLKDFIQDPTIKKTNPKQSDVPNAYALLSKFTKEKDK